MLCMHNKGAIFGVKCQFWGIQFVVLSLQWAVMIK